MRYIDHGHYAEWYPETEKDVQYLRGEYAHLWPFQSVCVFHPTEVSRGARNWFPRFHAYRRTPERPE